MIDLPNERKEWKPFLDYIWDYGNKRHIAKAEYEGKHGFKGSQFESRLTKLQPRGDDLRLS